MDPTTQHWVDLAGIVIITAVFLGSLRILERPRHKRVATMVFLLAACGFGIYTGDRWRVGGIVPLKYCAYGLLALLFVLVITGNMFRGGPLDPRYDDESPPYEEGES